jgi:hypothetical protein
MRLLILGILIYAGYRLLKSWGRSGRFGKKVARQEELTPVDDVMVKDPFCETYFPARKGVEGVMDGKSYQFCSTTCRDKFLASASGGERSEQALSNDE